MAHIQNIVKYQIRLKSTSGTLEITMEGNWITGNVFFWEVIQKKNICHVINQNSHLELKTILNDKMKQSCLHQPDLQLVTFTTVPTAQSRNLGI